MADIPTHTPNVLVRRRTGPERCAVCHDDEPGLALLATCRLCGSAVHLECRAELAGCPTLACGDAYPRRIVVQARPRRLGFRLHVPVELIAIAAFLSFLLIGAVTSFRSGLNNTFNHATKVQSGVSAPIGG